MSSKLICIFLCSLILCACRDNIIHDLNETEANRLVSKLSANKLDARKVKQSDGKWAISMPQNEMSDGINLLSSQRLIKDSRDSTIESPGFMSSREDQKFRYERALSKEIETTLSGIPGVIESRVHLNLPAMDPVFGSINAMRAGSSASILLIADKLSVSKEELAALVSGASGVPLEAVSIVVSTTQSENNKDVALRLTHNISSLPTASSGQGISRDHNFKVSSNRLVVLLQAIPGSILVMSIAFLSLVALLQRMLKQKRRFI